MQQALALVRQELGSSAAVLHTREIRGGGLWSWIPGLRQIEVTASKEVNVPSRLPPRSQVDEAVVKRELVPGIDWQGKSMFREELKGRLDELHSLVEELCRQSRRTGPSNWSNEMFRLFTDLIEAEVGEDTARELVQEVDCSAPVAVRNDAQVARNWLATEIAQEIAVHRPITVTPGKLRRVALVGPTGVGKTTTIAKLAANFRLREKRRVGLITVDTYRIAAVEQLRTYANIIELPMQVVTTGDDMRQAMRSMADLDLVLLDTAGRSPTDDVQLQELATLLEAAQPDEVQLTLSSVGNPSALRRTLERFAAIGTTGLILTKTDEAVGLGHLLPLLRQSDLPLSYVTNGQSVPDDIAPADARKLTRQMLGLPLVS